MGEGIDCTIRGFITDEATERAGPIEDIFTITKRAFVIQQPASRLDTFTTITIIRIQAIDIKWLATWCYPSIVCVAEKFTQGPNATCGCAVAEVQESPHLPITYTHEVREPRIVGRGAAGYPTGSDIWRGRGGKPSAPGTSREYG